MRGTELALFAFGVGLLVAATPSIVAQSGPHVLLGGPVTSRVIAYGPGALQGLELFTRVRAGRAPLIVYLHGGGWSAGSRQDGSRGAQADHWTALGYAYATVGYRLVPEVTAEEQLSDVALAIRLLGKTKEVDRDRIVLIGHSSGGTMAATIGSDPHWLLGAGVPFASVRAVVLLDPSVLDLPPVMAEKGAPIVQLYLRPAFGEDPARQSALSPMKQLEPPNAPAWLILTDANNGFSQTQGADLAAGLIGAGATEASVRPISGTTHMRLNNEIGQPADQATAEIDAFLGRALPEMGRARFR